MPSIMKADKSFQVSVLWRLININYKNQAFNLFLNFEMNGKVKMSIQQINTILIANRGEIASRIIRTCWKMGIKSVAIFSEADRESIFVREADTAVFIGESSPSKSYLNQEKIIEIAKNQNADAIHPGYGFLSENVDFAQKCKDSGIIFIGPHPEAIEAMGSKSHAKSIMQSHGVPTIPGYLGENQSLKALSEAAKKIGFPLLLKATAGGGGKGMRVVNKATELGKNIEAAKREAFSSFGNDELIIEKYISKGRHIEFQIFGDKHGNIIHILERECSIQRRYQKVLEESPSPVLTENLRKQMGEAAIKAAQALSYDNAGTVEFIFDDKTKDFYFLEVNTRLQVEHPVTEEVTGLDLVQMQIEVAEGRKLGITQSDIHGKGYAIEARLYAEDASNDFMPATGKVLHWEVPNVDGLRIETAIESGSDISIHYDPMIAKIIVWDQNRNTAHRKMAYTLRHLKCLGLTTNQDFLLHLLEQPAINEGNYDTHFIKNELDLSQLSEKTIEQKELASISVTLLNWQKREESRILLNTLPSGWRNNFYASQQATYFFATEEIDVKYSFQKDNKFQFWVNGNDSHIELIKVQNQKVIFRKNGIQHQCTVTQKHHSIFIHSPETGNIMLVEKERFPKKDTEKIKGGFEAPMPSQIIKVLVKEGQEVKSGQGLMIISSMKMENTIEAEKDGVVEEIFAKEGQNVEAGFLLLKLK